MVFRARHTEEGYSAIPVLVIPTQESAGNNGKPFKNHRNNFETPECSRDKGKCKYMGD